MYAYKVNDCEYECIMPNGCERLVGQTGVPLTEMTGIQGLTGVQCEKRCTGVECETEVTGLWEQPELINQLGQLPRVVPFYGKSRQGLEQVFEHVEQNPTDLGVHCLLNAHSQYTPKVYPYRGFTLVNGEQKVRQIEQVEQLEQRPVWFMFTGFGIEQWSFGLVKELMSLDLFGRSIMRSCELLKPYGIDLLRLVNGERQPVVGVESFVYLTSIQLALVDLLRQIGVKPDGLVGQSIGELVCAYVDGCLTHEQVLMVSYNLAKCIQQVQTLPKSLMAVVGGITWEQFKSRCPTGVVPVCFDLVDQFVITGPVQQVRDLLRQLRLEGLFVREIELPTTTTSTYNGVENFGLIHSQYLNEVVPVLRQCLQTLNIVPKQRSSRWVSTCVQESSNQWFSVDYLLTLFTSPVMLQQSLSLVPKNAILIEVSPRSLYQTLLRKYFIQPSTYGTPSSLTTTYSLTGLNDVAPVVIGIMPSILGGGVEGPSYLEHLLIQLGRLYVEGVEFDSTKLFLPFDLQTTVYPVPVSQQTVGLFSKWNVQLEPLSYYIRPQQQQQQQRPVEEVIMNVLGGLTISGGDVETFKFTVDVESLLEKESYLLNHQINGRVLYPTTGYLYLVWKSLAQLKKLKQQQTSRVVPVLPIQLDSVFGQPCEIEQLPPVCFENVQIHRATVLREQPQQIVVVPENRRVLFQINIQPSTGLFEIVEGKNLIVNGRVYVPTNTSVESFVTPFKTQWESQVRCNLVLPQEDIYQQFRQYGYEFNGEFQPIVRSNVLGTQGELLWTGKWIPFLDAMLQMNVLAQQQQQGEQKTVTGLILPTRIRSVKINPIEHLIRAEKFVTLPVVHDLYTNTTQCGCIEITGLQVTPVVLPKGQFYPTINTTETGISTTTTTTTTTGLTGLPTTTPYGRYLCVDGEQVPTQFGSRWLGAQQQHQQPIGKVFSLGGQWTIEQPKWSVFGGIEQVEQQTFNPRLTHVIVGGLDCQFGLELAQWMVQHGGVRYLVLTTQRITGEQQTLLSAQQVQQLRYLQNEFGCQIKIVSTLDLTNETECLLFVKQACRMTSHLEGKIGSIFHLGGLLVEQPTSFHIKSLYHLDKHTRCPTVMPEYGLFVAFTRSVYNGLTQTGLQTVVEGVCESRRRECGKHGLVVDWTVLFGGEQQPTGVHYKQALVKLEQLLVKSLRVQLPAVEQQQWIEQTPAVESLFGEFPVSFNQWICIRPRRQVGEDKQVYTVMPTTVVQKLNDVEYVFGQSTVVPLFVVLPVELPITLVKSWAQKLRVPVYGLHYTAECLKYETVEQLAQFYWQQIENVFPLLDKFHLVGHSYGIPVAFEMALRRPQQILSFVMLDSGLTQTFLNGSFYGGISEVECLYKIYQQFVVVPSVRMTFEQFTQVLSQYQTFDERVKYVVGKIVEQSQYGFDLVDLEQGVRCFVKTMIISSKYIPSQPLRLPRILVVRPTCQAPVDYIYGQQLFEQELVENVFVCLRRFVSGKILVHLVDCEDQSHFIQGETGVRVANVLNQYLA